MELRFRVDFPEHEAERLLTTIRLDFLFLEYANRLEVLDRFAMTKGW